MKLSFLEIFADALKAKFSLPGSASPEDQLKPVVADLLKSAGNAYGLAVDTRTETHLSDHKVRPDIAFYVDGLICGYIELKAPGLGADAPKLKGEHNKKQWEKLKGLPNLIYTDGREWALYRGGERPDGQPIVRLHDDPTDKGKAATTKADAEGLERLFRDFLGWRPSVPHSPSGLAKYLAPLSRLLRSEVESALGQSGSAVKLLANEWRQFFFPDSDNAKFADAYAQTVTYAMLLARLSGATKLDPADAAKTLDKNNGLLARTLELLGQAEARKELSVGFEMLQRSLEALDPHDFLKSKPDLWLYFYEDFLAAYDPKLRKDYGVYYTPREVVELQVRLASELLEKRFGKKLGFADDGVVFLDPAVGTGTYPVAAVKHGLEKVAKRSGKPAVPERARQMAENMYGFEVLVGPYAVAHLRLTQALEGAINDSKAAGEPEEKLGKRLNIYLADTLESPNSAPPGGLDLTHRMLTQEHEAARKMKNGGEILVCLGNPPYDRQAIEQGDMTTQRKGGWVRFGDQVKGGAKQEDQGDRAIFKDFTEPATNTGAAVHIKNLYNDYIYFWRWALWRLFEQQKCGGIITFITASSYLAGPGFVGVRHFMRRTFDEDLAALGEILFGQVAETGVEQDDAVPFRALDAFAAVLVLPALTCGDAEADDLAVLGAAHLWVAAKVSDDLRDVTKSRHFHLRSFPLSSSGPCRRVPSGAASGKRARGRVSPGGLRAGRVGRRRARACLEACDGRGLAVPVRAGWSRAAGRRLAQGWPGSWLASGRSTTRGCAGTGRCQY